MEMGSCIRDVDNAAAVGALENPAGHKAAASAASPLGAERSPTVVGRTVCRHFETPQTWFLTSLTLQDLHGTDDRFIHGGRRLNEGPKQKSHAILANHPKMLIF